MQHIILSISFLVVFPFRSLSCQLLLSHHLSPKRTNMNECRSDDRKWCYFHPRELVIGICALCLNERLLVLASKKGSLHQTHKTFSATTKKAPIVLTKIFALTNLLNRLEIKQQKPADDQYCHSSSTSQEGQIFFYFVFLSVFFTFLELPSIKKRLTEKGGKVHIIW